MSAHRQQIDLDIAAQRNCALAVERNDNVSAGRHGVERPFRCIGKRGDGLASGRKHIDGLDRQRTVGERGSGSDYVAVAVEDRQHPFRRFASEFKFNRIFHRIELLHMQLRALRQRNDALRTRQAHKLERNTCADMDIAFTSHGGGHRDGRCFDAFGFGQIERGAGGDIYWLDNRQRRRRRAKFRRIADIDLHRHSRRICIDARLSKRQNAAVEIKDVLISSVPRKLYAPCRKSATLNIDCVIIARKTDKHIARRGESSIIFERERAWPVPVTEHDRRSVLVGGRIAGYHYGRSVSEFE